MGTDGGRDSQRDDFWDIQKLIPAKKNRLAPFSAGPTLHTVQTTAPTGEATVGVDTEAHLRFTAEPVRGEEVETYTPSDNPLLLRVTIRRKTGGYSFYEQFRRDATRFFSDSGQVCDYIPFFSYTPQYTQLSSEQRSYYCHWRQGVREGHYLKTDKSYFFLYVYEIINLPELISPAEGIGALCRLWAAYRAELPGIDRYMIAWIVDYCLIYRLPCPRDLPADCLSAVSQSTGLLEFFFGAAGSTALGTERLLALSSDYRFENSRAVTPQNREAFPGISWQLWKRFSGFCSETG